MFLCSKLSIVQLHDLLASLFASVTSLGAQINALAVIYLQAQL